MQLESPTHVRTQLNAIQSHRATQPSSAAAEPSRIASLSSRASLFRFVLPHVAASPCSPLRAIPVVQSFARCRRVPVSSSVHPAASIASRRLLAGLPSSPAGLSSLAEAKQLAQIKFPICWPRRSIARSRSGHCWKFSGVCEMYERMSDCKRSRENRRRSKADHEAKEGERMQLQQLQRMREG